MARNYRSIREIRQRVDGLERWADTRNTHLAVAAALHAIADGKRAAEAIWENPTPAEWDHITMAVDEYVREGDVIAEEDGRYPWGEEAVILQSVRP